MLQERSSERAQWKVDERKKLIIPILLLPLLLSASSEFIQLTTVSSRQQTTESKFASNTNFQSIRAGSIGSLARVRARVLSCFSAWQTTAAAVGIVTGF